ncbi:MAG: alanine racemase, partial [Clostridia bacterium]|nr:alanine racemase [Clostridia bacterium]
IDKDILCLTPFFEQDLSQAVRCNLTATVSSAEHIKMIDAEAKRQNKKVKVHIKFNAGMNRQGVNYKELKDLLQLVSDCKWVILDGAYAHLSFPENEKSRNLQVNKFLLANNLVKGYNNKAICHISASGALLTGVRSDMARIGILLYGYKPFESNLIDVTPAMKVYAPLLENRKLKKGETALYGDKLCSKDVDISLIRYGYADGLMRKEVKGQFNNRCMDLTAVMGFQGDFYTVMQDADALAKKYGTISYEILTKSAMRAEKIYLR